MGRRRSDNKINMPSLALVNKRSCFIIDEKSIVEEMTTYLHQFPEMTIKGSSETTNNIVELFLTQGFPDILILNIDLEGSMDLLNHQQMIRKKIRLIFVSKDKNRAYEGFMYEALAFLPKPIDHLQFLAAIHKAYDFTQGTRSRDYFFIQSESKGNIIKIFLDELKYVETNGNYVNIVTDKNTYTHHYALKEFEKIYPLSIFFRIHSSYIVNYERIVQYNNDNVILDDETKLKVGPKYKTALRNRLLGA
ncbi:MAG: LytTR family DNA-binding domain-containing protein [Bacteroidota bacterium]